jgi:hypothetical protein
MSILGKLDENLRQCHALALVQVKRLIPEVALRITDPFETENRGWAKPAVGIALDAVAATGTRRKGP